jgi:tRNA pseudouridine13 synthase
LSGWEKSGILGGIMRIKVFPGDFAVIEVLAVPLAEGGRYAVYRARKRAITTLQLQNRLAAALGLSASAVAFPALKDRQAVAVQFGTVRDAGPPQVKGRGFTAERVGWLDRRLSPCDLAGNRFSAVLRDLCQDEAARVTVRLAEMAHWGLPNYFDEQRFGSRLADGEFPGRLILRRDEAGALRAHLAGQQIGDTAEVRAFKAFAAVQWGDWEAIFARAPKPSNYRSVLTYLCHHPDGYRRALNLVTPRVLSLYLAAYQSFLWNQLAGRTLQAKLETADVPLETVNIGGETLPIYRQLPQDLLASLEGIKLPLLHHRLQPEDPTVASFIETILDKEGFTLRDLKARVLKNAYLGKGARALLLLPRDLTWGAAEADERFPGRYKLTVRFFLARGSYATLLFKAASIDDLAFSAASPKEKTL